MAEKKKHNGLIAILAIALAAALASGVFDSPSESSSSSTQSATSSSAVASKSSASSSLVVEDKPDVLLNRTLWAGRMSLPSDDAIKSYKATQRSPYVVCRPDFPDTSGYYEYAVDFKVDSQPRGTYLSICNWDMDISSLQSRYTDVHREYSGVAAYAGFQVLADGTKVAIMSVWDTYVTDANGTATTIHATKTYPANPRRSQSFGGEGQGIQTIVDYDWQLGRTYRALIQCNQTSTGNCELVFYVCDLTTGAWTELVAYDLGYSNTYMTSACCFLENYLLETAASVRTVELSNFRAHSVEIGSWVSAYSATMEENYEYPGSYAYGSDDTCFWAITSGIPGLCESPENYEWLSVSNAQEGSPY